MLNSDYSLEKVRIDALAKTNHAACGMNWSIR